MINLDYSTIGQFYDTEGKDHRHAQTVMRELGITYFHAVPQSIADAWWFFDCENVPDELPPWIKPRDFGDFRKFVGYGLSAEMADELNRRAAG